MNAYTGAVTLYQWGPADPMLNTWMNAFPGVIKPSRDIPADLRPHLRYPPDLFEVQRQILAQYHVLNPQSFYGGQNFWTVPDDPTGSGNAGNLSQPPYYLTMTMPGYHQPSFSLTTTLAQRARPNLAAYMAVNSNPQGGYGTIRILQLPQDAAILGPQQVQNNFESNTTASKELSLFRQGGSSVIKGNLIALPFGDGLLYEEPIYIRAAGGTSAGSYPTLRRVFVFFDGQVGYGLSLQGALAQVFTGLPSAGAGRAQRHGRGGQRARPQVPAAGRAGLHHGAGRPAGRQPGRLCPGHRADEAGARQRPAGRREGIGRGLREHPVARPQPHPYRRSQPVPVPVTSRSEVRARPGSPAGAALLPGRAAGARGPRWKAYARWWGLPPGMLVSAGIRVPGPGARERSETGCGASSAN